MSTGRHGTPDLTPDANDLPTTSPAAAQAACLNGEQREAVPPPVDSPSLFVPAPVAARQSAAKRALDSPDGPYGREPTPPGAAARPRRPGTTAAVAAAGSGRQDQQVLAAAAVTAPAPAMAVAATKAAVAGGEVPSSPDPDPNPAPATAPAPAAAPLAVAPAPAPVAAEAAAGSGAAGSALLARCISCGSAVCYWGYTAPDGRYSCHLCCHKNRQATGFYGPLGTTSRAQAEGGQARSCAECGATSTCTWRGHKERPGSMVCNACHQRYKRAGTYARASASTSGAAAAAALPAPAAAAPQAAAAAAPAASPKALGRASLQGGLAAAAAAGPTREAPPESGSGARLQPPPEGGADGGGGVAGGGSSAEADQGQRQRQRCAECGSETTSYGWRAHKTQPELVTCRKCYDRYRLKGSYAEAGTGASEGKSPCFPCMRSHVPDSGPGTATHAHAATAASAGADGESDGGAGGRSADGGEDLSRGGPNAAAVSAMLPPLPPPLPAPQPQQQNLPHQGQQQLQQETLHGQEQQPQQLHPEQQQQQCQRCAECGSETTSYGWRAHKTRPGLLTCRRCYDRFRLSGEYPSRPCASEGKTTDLPRIRPHVPDSATGATTHAHAVATGSAAGADGESDGGGGGGGAGGGKDLSRGGPNAAVLAALPPPPPPSPPSPAPQPQQQNLLHQGEQQQQPQQDKLHGQEERPQQPHPEQQQQQQQCQRCAECGSETTSYGWRTHKIQPGLVTCRRCYDRFRLSGAYPSRPCASEGKTTDLPRIRLHLPDSGAGTAIHAHAAATASAGADGESDGGGGGGGADGGGNLRRDGSNALALAAMPPPPPSPAPQPQQQNQPHQGKQLHRQPQQGELHGQEQRPQQPHPEQQQQQCQRCAECVSETTSYGWRTHKIQPGLLTCRRCYDRYRLNGSYAKARTGGLKRKGGSDSAAAAAVGAGIKRGKVRRRWEAASTEEDSETEEESEQAEDEDVRCEVCRSPHDAARMLLCDGCDTGWHLRCLDPPLASVPRGAWMCPECSNLLGGRSQPAAQAPRQSLQQQQQPTDQQPQRQTPPAKMAAAAPRQEKSSPQPPSATVQKQLQAAVMPPAQEQQQVKQKQVQAAAAGAVAAVSGKAARLKTRKRHFLPHRTPRQKRERRRQEWDKEKAKTLLAQWQQWFTAASVGAAGGIGSGQLPH